MTGPASGDRGEHGHEDDQRPVKGFRSAGWTSRLLPRWGSNRVPQLVFVVIALAMVVFVVVPIGSMLIQTVYSGHAGFLGLRIYSEVFGQPQIERALEDTGLMAVVSTTIALCLGTVLAWIISSTNMPLVRYLGIIPLLPMFLPPLIGAIGWEFLLSPGPGLLNILLRDILPGAQASGPLNIYSLWGIMWVNSIYVTPYVYLIALTAFRQYDTSLDEAARVAGSGTLATFRRVTVPLLRPGLMAGVVLALITSLGDFSIPLILGAPNQTPFLTTQIYDELSNFPENDQAAAALSIITIIITITALYVQRRMLRGQNRFVTLAGKGARRRLTDLGRIRRWVVFVLLLAYIVLTVVVPIIAIFNVSLRRYWTANLGLHGVTWSNYSLVFHDSIAVSSVRNSLELAFIGASVGMLLAVLIAQTVQRSKVRGRSALDYISTIPLAIPGTVFGASLLIFFLNGPIVLYGSDLLLLIAYIAFFLPQGFRTASASLAQLSPELEESAMVCGSGWFGAMRSVTLPLLTPAIASGWIFMFILISREVSMSALLASDNTTVMSVAIINFWQNGYLPELAAFSVIVLLISAVLTVLAQVIGNRRRLT